MSHLREIPLVRPVASVAALQDFFGFVPNLFRCQALIPRLIEAETQLLSTIVFKETTLSHLQKDCIFLIASAVYGDSYGVSFCWERLRSKGRTDFQIESFLSAGGFRPPLPDGEAALLDFSIRLNQSPLQVSSMDIDQLRATGLDDKAILDAVLANALARMLCTVSAGLSPGFDFERRELPAASFAGIQNAYGHQDHPRPAVDTRRPYLSSPELRADSFEPFAFFEGRLGVVPNLFRAQTLRPDAILAETRAADLIIANEEVLPQSKKECILLLNAAANLNSYCVAAHCAMLRGLGSSPEETDQIAIDHRQAGLPGSDIALLDFTLKLGTRPADMGLDDIDLLREVGFTDEQVLESVVTTGFGSFLNTLVAGLGAAPDFDPGRVLERRAGERSQPIGSPDDASDRAAKSDDPDTEFVARVQAGDIEAFGELVRRHEQRVYRTLIGILRDPEAAQDAVQDAFLKAFQHIRDFQGRSKFVTWLMTISRNAAIQLLRDREEIESLDEGGEQEEGLRPRQIRAWQDNPEELYSKSEIRHLVERELLKLPSKYRVVIMLRDIEQLPASEVSEILGLSIAAVKARLFRARMMLRDGLSARFAVSAGRSSA